MNIGIDAKRAIFNESGLGNYSRTLIHSLKNHYPQNNYTLYYPFPISDSSRKRVLEMSHFKCITPANWFSRNFSALWRSYFIRRRISAPTIDIYHGLSHELPAGIKKTGVKSVVTVHDLIFKSHPHLYRYLDVIAYDHKCKMACRNADLIVSVSENTKREIIDLYNIMPDKVKVVYQAVNPTFEKPISSDTLKKVKSKYNLKKEFILYVGSLNARKNLKNLIKAYSLLDKNSKNSVNNRLNNQTEDLLIVGRGEKHKKELMSLVNELNLQNRVHFFSDVLDDELPSVYKLAKIFVYPSIYEGFGIPIIESLFAGTPVVVSKEPIFKEAGGQGAFYTDVLQPKKLASSMKKLLSDSMLRNTLIKAGKLHIKKFTSKACAKNMIDVYAEVLK